MGSSPHGERGRQAPKTAVPQNPASLRQVSARLEEGRLPAAPANILASPALGGKGL